MTNTILVIAAHPDDEVLGCGGAIARHTALGDQVHVLFMADGETSRIAPDADADAVMVDVSENKRREAAQGALNALGVSERIFLDWPDNRLDTIPLLDLVQSIEPVIARLRPDIIYTHFDGDLNVDHQQTARAVFTACRPQPEFSVTQIICFEVLSSTEWNPAQCFMPNYWVDVSEYLPIKEKALAFYDQEMRAYPHTRSYQNVRQLAGVRGATIGVEYAEAFMIARMIER
jgi:LmbE family N-acetylglucosaminyl deacetylase